MDNKKKIFKYSRGTFAMVLSIVAFLIANSTGNKFYSLIAGLIGVFSGFLFIYFIYSERNVKEKIKWDERLQHLNDLSLRYSWGITVLFMAVLFVLDGFYPLSWTINHILLVLLSISLLSAAAIRFILENIK